MYEYEANLKIYFLGTALHCTVVLKKSALLIENMNLLGYAPLLYVRGACRRQMLRER